MKRIWKGCLIAVILFIVLMVAIFLIITKTTSKKMDTYDAFNYAGLDLASIEDGVYTGSEDAGIVKATVEVTVENHIITKIAILKHDNGKGKPAEVITEDIIQSNSLDVDAISGATFSSNVIKMAVYNALTKK
ncbi:MAG: uncharacterized protein K0S47_548 [Herbinix sp.]|jgi:uncharacterized protein with FMN-binding domain|nr:uncharacterized protein [Herbinix sp.]